MFRSIHTALVCICSLLLATTLEAQRVSGIITRTQTGALVAGALVSAYTERGDTVPATLSSSTGRFAIDIPVGRTLTLFVRSIGLQPVRRNIGPLAAGTNVVIDIRMEPVIWTLASVRVETVTLCDRKDAGTDRVAQLWAEVTKSLETSRQTQMLKRQYDWQLFQNVINARTGERTESTSEGSTLSARPFQAETSKDLYESGFVISDPKGLMFRAPDETVLMDEHFLEAHCFWVTPMTEDGVAVMALSFTPVDGLRVNDIAGAFFIDATTFELKRLRFNFTRILGNTIRRYREDLVERGRDLPPRVVLDSLHSSIDPALAIPGGELRFKRFPDGTVIVDKFKLWATDNWVRIDVSLLPLPRPSTIRESGGEIVKVGGE